MLTRLVSNERRPARPAGLAGRKTNRPRWTLLTRGRRPARWPLVSTGQLKKRLWGLGPCWPPGQKGPRCGGPRCTLVHRGHRGARARGLRLAKRRVASLREAQARSAHAHVSRPAHATDWLRLDEPRPSGRAARLFPNYNQKRKRISKLGMNKLKNVFINLLTESQEHPLLHSCRACL